MVLDKENIRRNSVLLYSKMRSMYRYTFDELEKLVNFGSVELCLALMQLLQENKITQDRGSGGVCYAVI